MHTQPNAQRFWIRPKVTLLKACRYIMLYNLCQQPSFDLHYQFWNRLDLCPIVPAKHVMITYANPIYHHIQYIVKARLSNTVKPDFKHHCVPPIIYRPKFLSPFDDASESAVGCVSVGLLTAVGVVCQFHWDSGLNGNWPLTDRNPSHSSSTVCVHACVITQMRGPVFAFYNNVYQYQTWVQIVYVLSLL